MAEPERSILESIKAQEEVLDTFWARHRFFLMVFGTIIVALVLVVVSLVMYNVGGTAQLDLSRPGYQSVSDQVERTDAIDGFSSVGPVDADVIQEFIELYDEQAAKATAVDAFNGDPLNPELLEFTTPTGAQ